MRKIQQAVRDFHIAFDHPAPSAPVMQGKAVASKRSWWIKDECDELEMADTIEDQADAYIDIIYFALGGLVEMGLDGKPIFDIVQTANMAKLGPDGKPIKTPEGRVVKPEGWTPPDDLIRAEITRQVKAAGGK